VQQFSCRTEVNCRLRTLLPNSSEETFLLPEGFLTALDPQVKLLTLPNFGVNKKLFTTPGRAIGFGSCTASVICGKFCNGDLTETLMLHELCEFCCAGTAQPNGAGLRCRKRGRLTFGAEGMEEPEVPRVGCASAREWRRPGRDVPKGPTRPGQDHGLFRRRRCCVSRYVAAANV
jgi:hypothetical protein